MYPSRHPPHPAVDTVGTLQTSMYMEVKALLPPATHECHTPVWCLELSSARLSTDSPVKALPPQPRIGAKHRCGVWIFEHSGAQRHVWRALSAQQALRAGRAWLRPPLSRPGSLPKCTPMLFSERQLAKNFGHLRFTHEHVFLQQT